MLKIRLKRTGRKNDPHFRVVVAEHARAAKAGTNVEEIGHYNPITKERSINIERVTYWMSVGAQPSGTVWNMLVSDKVIEGKKVNVLPKKQPPNVETPNEETSTKSVPEAAKAEGMEAVVEAKPAE